MTLKEDIDKKLPKNEPTKSTSLVTWYRKALNIRLKKYGYLEYSARKIRLSPIFG